MKVVPPDRPQSGEDPPAALPTTITYEPVLGVLGLWRASIDTSAGPIRATGHSLGEAREALEIQVRDLRSAKAQDSPVNGATN